MAVVLTILKILGIILLIVLGILLLLVLLVLLVPVRYKVKGGYSEEDITADLNVRWLFFRVLGKFTKAGGLSAQAKIGFITVYRLNGEAKPEDGKSKKKKKSAEELPAPVEGATQEASGSPAQGGAAGTDSTGPDGLPEGTTPDDVMIFGEGHPDPKDKKAKKAAKKAEKEAAQKAKEAEKAASAVLEGEVEEDKPSALQQKLDQVEELRNKIATKKSHVDQFLARETTQRTLQRLKKLLIKIFKHLKPTKGEIYLTMGLGSAADTGMILGKVAMFYPLYGKWLFITPDFYYKRIEAEGAVKGRIRLGSIAVPGLIFYLRKDTRRTIKLAKKI